MKYIRTKMSKELEAFYELLRANSISTLTPMPPYDKYTPIELYEETKKADRNRELIHVIETALKRLEKYDDEELEYDHANRGLTIELLCRENHKLVKEHKALAIIKEIFKFGISIDENENDKPCGMVFLVGSKDLIWTIYETFDKENIQKLKLLKEVLL